MLLISRKAFSSKELIPHLIKQDKQILGFINYQIIFKKPSPGKLFQQRLSHDDLRRLLHTTNVRRDLETGFRAIGAGLAATGVTGSGIGIGYIFGSFLNSTARNPSIGNKAYTSAIIGAAFCESLALFAIAVALVVMP